MSSHNETPSSRNRFFGNPPWIGFRHDGYRVLPLDEYLEERPGNVLKDSTSWSAATAVEIAASFQSLLTFGLIEAVMEWPIPERKFVKFESGRLVMTREHLNDLMVEFLQRVKACQPEELDGWEERIATNFARARAWIHHLSRSGFALFNVLQDDTPSMVSFLAIFYETLAHACKYLRRQRPASSKDNLGGQFWLQFFADNLQTDMVAKGWCPYTAAYMIDTYPVSVLEYAHQCGPARDGERHVQCSPRACATQMVDLDTYNPKHASSCNPPTGTSCNYSAPPLDDVKQLILAEETPVFTLTNGLRPDSVQLHLHRASSVRYVAISHVWADGLGSTADEGLPTCQLRRIASLVSKIEPDAAFWIDGMSLPRDDRVRAKAMGTMAQIYAQANAVLVLDSGLQMCSSAEPVGVQALRIITSGWILRLWTLQEGFLAQRLHFAFADATLRLADLIPPERDVKALFPHLSYSLGHMLKLRGSSRTRSLLSLGRVAQMLAWRTTNRPSDETLAIASLLNIHSSALVGLSPGTRMIRLLQGARKLPRCIIFLPGPKLEVPGFHWAPASLMKIATDRMLKSIDEPDDAPDGPTLTLRGLEARYYCLFFPREMTFERGKLRNVRDPVTNKLYQVVGDSLPGSYTFNIVIMHVAIPRRFEWSGVAAFASPGSAVRRPLSTSVIHCEYRQRLTVSREFVTVHTGDFVDCEHSGWATLCIG